MARAHLAFELEKLSDPDVLRRFPSAARVQLSYGDRDDAVAYLRAFADSLEEQLENAREAQVRVA